MSKLWTSKFGNILGLLKFSLDPMEDFSLSNSKMDNPQTKEEVDLKKDHHN